MNFHYNGNKARHTCVSSHGHPNSQYLKLNCLLRTVLTTLAICVTPSQK